MEIDVDALRDYLLDYCGTAVFAGFGPALLDVADIERDLSKKVKKIEEDAKDSAS